MTRFWADGEPISVQVDADGLPAQFTWRGQTHVVQRIANRWRIEDEWWRGRVSREYFKVTTQTLHLLMYHDAITGVWRLQRVYD